MSTEAEKIIAEALRYITDDDVPGSLDTVSQYVATALRDAGMLTETEWVYGVYSPILDNVSSGPWIDIEYAKKVSANNSGHYGVRRRAPGPWSPIPEGTE